MCFWSKKNIKVIIYYLHGSYITWKYMCSHSSTLPLVCEEETTTKIKRLLYFERRFYDTLTRLAWYLVQTLTRQCENFNLNQKLTLKKSSIINYKSELKLISDDSDHLKSALLLLNHLNCQWLVFSQSSA